MSLQKETTQQQSSNADRGMQVAPSKQPAYASMHLPIKELGAEKLYALLQTAPDTEVVIKMGTKTATALLERTDLLKTNHHVGDSTAAVAAPEKHETSAGAEPASDETLLQRYLASPAGLYRLDHGFSLEYSGKSLGKMGTVLYDTGSEIGLLSQRCADMLGIKYASSSTKISTSMGGSGNVVGEVEGPLICVLNKGAQAECKTHSPAATRFYVVQGVEHMYDVLLSTHVAKDWAATPDPLLSLLEYRPFLLKGDIKTKASVPLISTSRRSPGEYLTAGVFICATTVPTMPDECKTRAPRTRKARKSKKANPQKRRPNRPFARMHATISPQEATARRKRKSTGTATNK